MDRFELARLLGASHRVEEPGGAPIVISEADPQRFMAAFSAAVGAGGPIFLADPYWTAGQRRQLDALQSPQSEIPDPQSAAGKGWLCIPTGGTTGALKLARHDEDTVVTAVRGFCAHFATRQVNAIGILPLHHVGGLMAWMRCTLTSGAYRPWDWKALESGECPPLLTHGDWFISLVPTQLKRLLDRSETVAWLRNFRAIVVSGGPAWGDLAEAAASAKLPISLSYGMTETAAMVAALRPAEFLRGARNVGLPLPHARIAVGADGLITVAGESVFRGYWPEWRETREFTTEDLGQFDERGYLQVLGRRDAVIITGGKKVNPVDVETVLRSTGEFEDVAVIGMPDPEWGETVVACYPAGRAPDMAKVAAQMDHLQSHQRPKHFRPISQWPANDMGKVNRTALRAMLVAR